MKKSSGGGEFKYDVFDTCNNLVIMCKCHNIPSPSKTIKEKD
jgi:hypothetical protein